MTEKEIAVLEKIVEKEGNCLSAPLCEACPFRLECLPPFIVPNKQVLSEGKRCQMALSALNSMVFEDML